MELQKWREILAPYELAVKELTVKFQHIISEYHARGAYCPIEQVTGRVKTISSILEKSRKKKIPLECIQDRIEDIAGMRIMCQFVDDIYTVVEMLHARTDMEITEEIDYIKNSKESGYRSYHVVIHYVVHSSYGIKTIPVEIQIRTLAMNFWAIVEHSLQYKYHKNIPLPIRERLIGAAEAVVKLDAEMAEIREEILEAQSSFRVRANIVQDILNTLRSLSLVASTDIVSDLQSEFFRIHQDDNTEELYQFSLRLDQLAEQYRAQDINKGKH